MSATAEVIAQRWRPVGKLWGHADGHSLHLTLRDLDEWRREYVEPREESDGAPFTVHVQVATLQMLDRAKKQGRPGVRIRPKGGTR